jgi:hypothetical protein
MVWDAKEFFLLLGEGANCWKRIVFYRRKKTVEKNFTAARVEIKLAVQKE